MKVKAVIFSKTREPIIFVVSAKKLKASSFRYGDYVYFLDPDCMMVTTRKPWWTMWTPVYYATYYYRQGHPKPLPLPDFAEWEGKPVVDTGVSSEELAAMFNPWFYRTIAPQSRGAWEYVQLYLLVACAALSLYLVWILTTGRYVLPGA